MGSRPSVERRQEEEGEGLLAPSALFEKNAALNITKILTSGFEIILPGNFKKIGQKIRVR